jgi:glycosyltransferase involved in cell wall biosynthesis
MVGARESHNDALARELGLEDCVVWRGYVPHRDAIEAMREATVLVLIKHVEPRFRGLIPGKLYEYMGAGRPILALVPDSEAADLVRDLGWGEVAPPDDPEAIAAALLRLLERHRAGQLLTAYPRRGREQFERRTQAHAVAALLDTLVAAHR